MPIGSWSLQALGRPAAPQTAEDLLQIWQGGAAQHVALGGGGCACCADGVVVQLADFEQDIVDYLLAEAEGQKRSDVLDLMRDCAQRLDGRWSIGQLLETMSASAVESDAAAFVLSRLGRSLQSFTRGF